MDWIFQANPKLYDLPAAIASGFDRNWAMNQGRSMVTPGDRVFFWISGHEARLIATGSVASPVYEREESDFGKFLVDVIYENEVEPPLRRDEILSSDSLALRTFKPFAGFMGTNARIKDAEVVNALVEALQGRLRPITVGSGIPAAKVTTSTVQHELDKAIKDARHDASRELKLFIETMDPIAFEWLIRSLLAALGYTDVQVTKPSNDGGIDLRAKLVAGGIANLQTAVQVKRTASVSRPTIQSLRGSLSAHESGLLVTSGRFTDGAREESQDPTKAAIALVDGTMLVDLLLEHEIGAKQRTYKAYTLDTSSLTLELLQAKTAMI